MSLTPLGDIGIALKADVDDYQKSMATASELTGSLTGIVRSLGSAMRNTGMLMTAASGVAGAALFSLSQRAQQVNSAFREVDTLVQGAANSKEKYGQIVSDLNTEFGLQADKLEVIEGLYQSVSAGVEQSTEAQREFLSTAAELAVVGRVELGTAVDVLSTVMNTYGYEASAAEDISESLFQTVQFGKTRMEDLAPVLGRVAALGSNLGIQIDEIGASMGVLTRTGFGARVAATGLRNIFRAMLKPSERMQEVLFQIASEQDFFASQFGESSEKIKGIAQDFREASEAVDKFAKKEAAARATQESASTAIQEARLKIQALESDRLDQLPELTNAQVKEADSVEKLESVIDSYQFKVNKARIQEKKFRKEKEEKQKALEEERGAISDIIAQNGDLEGGIGQLILENQNFIDTMVDLREKVNNTSTSMSDLFPRTRALQGALALVGEDGQMLTDIFKQMEEGTFDARKAWDEMDESVRKNFDSFEDFKKATDDVSAGDLEETFQKAQGPQQKLRNSIAELKGALTTLGDTFTEDVVDKIAAFANNFNRAIERFDNMEESARENISQFALLATSIGLVLGPILFLGGQLAIIASVMGTSLIPFLAISAVLFGTLAGAIQTLRGDGERSQQLIANLSSTFDDLIVYLRSAKALFRTFVTPELISLGKTVFSIFGEISEKLSGITGEGNSVINVMYAFFTTMGEVISQVDKFLTKNEDLIVNGITALVRYIVNQAIPAFMDLARGIIAVLMDIDWTKFAWIGVLIVGLVKTIVPLIGWIGRWMQKNSELIGTLITWAAILGGIAFTIGKIAMALAPVISGISSLVSIISIAGGPTVAFLSAASGIASVITYLAGAFPALATAVKVFITVGKALIGVVSTIAGVLGLPVWATAALIAAILSLIAASYIMRDEILASFKNMADTIVDVLQIIFDAIHGEISWEEAGARIVDRIAKGMIDHVKNMGAAAQTLMGTVADYLPSSPANKGPFKKTPPSEYGDNISSGVAEGMDLEGDIGSQFKNLEEYNFDVESGMEMPSDVPDKYSTENMPNGTSGSGMGMGKEINFKEGSITVGPFHGISDEDLPEEVRDQVETVLEEEVVERIEGRGQGEAVGRGQGATATIS